MTSIRQQLGGNEGSKAPSDQFTGLDMVLQSRQARRPSVKGYSHPACL